MKKFLSVLLAAMLVVGCCASASADVLYYQYKVEIQDALTQYAADYSAANGYNVTIETLGGGGDYKTALKAKNAAGEMPDIFVVDGVGDYELWQETIEDLSDQPWVANTSVALTVDGKVYGFPVAVEGYGMAYNPTILEKAGVDPATMNTFEGYQAAFEKIDSMKEELGLNAVVAMCASVATGMTWVTGGHNFGIYLSDNMYGDDTTVIDEVLAGKLDEKRFADYADYVKLLFDYSDQDILLNGNYDAQIAAFAEGKCAFIHQGNWIDPSLSAYTMDFEPAFVPHAFLKGTPVTGIVGGAPHFMVINSKSENKEQAKAFLNSIAMTDEGQDYMVNKAAMVPAFSNVTLQPSTPLSKSLQQYVSNGAIFLWRQGDLPEGFTGDTLGPIYELLAQNAIDVPTFIVMMQDAIASLAK